MCKDVLAAISSTLRAPLSRLEGRIPSCADANRHINSTIVSQQRSMTTSAISMMKETLYVEIEGCNGGVWRLQPLLGTTGAIHQRPSLNPPTQAF
jgi:hypothetical protein